MSINVNVNGNPISINRGKMVISDPNYAKNEFEKRRKIRLEQVREQSKSIAENVRNKVRKEKDKQLSDLERKGEKELKKWQAKKLLDLQKQYHECLQDMGLGHMQAVIEEESDYDENIRKEDQVKIAQKRGHEAAERVNQEKVEEELERIAFLNRKKYNQAVEKTRSSMVVNLNKPRKSPFKKKRKQVSTNINIESRLSAGSDTENEMPGLLQFSNQYSSPSSDFSYCEAQNESARSSSPVIRKDQPANDVTHRAESNITAASTKNVVEIRQIRKSGQSFPQTSCSTVNWPLDTRISDHIRSRSVLHTKPNTCECDPDQKPASPVCSDRSRSPQKSTQTDLQTLELPKSVTAPAVTAQESKSIPNKPKITLRTATNPKTTSKSKSPHSNFVNKPASNKVQYYDHKNRFTKEYTNDKKNVHRIEEDCIEVCASLASDTDYQEQMNKRDRDAQIRGKEALQKVKVRKDYQEMMQQLPNLQKQEKIAAIPSRNTKFHMSEERLKKMEKKKQNHMENAYDKLFSRPRTITIPPKSPTKPVSNNLPYQTIDIDDDSPSLNVASWDFDAKPSTSTKPSHIESEIIKKIADKVLSEASSLENVSSIQTAQNLQGMLRNLTTSRDKLVKELEALPQDSELHSFLAKTGGLQNIDKIIEAGRVADRETSSTTRKRGRSKKRDDNTKEMKKISPYEVERSSISPERLRKTSKYHQNCSGESSTSPSPPSKRSYKPEKSKKDVKKPLPLPVQTISTQTTPRIEEAPDSGTKKNLNTLLQSKATDSCNKCNLPTVLEVPSKELLSEADLNKKSCSCNLEGSNIKNVNGDMCEIIIRISENGKPQICVSPTKVTSKEIIIKTGIEEVTQVGNPPIEICNNEKLNQLKIDETREQYQINKASAKQKSSKIKLPTRQKVPFKSSKVNNQIVEQRTHSKLLQGKSWREYLSQNSTNSSTSYFSPPDIAKCPQFTNSVPSEISGYFNSTSYNSFQNQSFVSYHQPTTQPRHKFSDILKDKPQQRNVLSQSNTEKSFVKTLLTMSRKSIEDLGVSTISDVSTPSSSIINISTNFNVQQIQNAMKNLNFEIPNASRPSSFSPVESNFHYNTLDSLVMSSTDDSKFNSVRINEDPQVPDPRTLTLDEYCAENYSSVLSTYNKMAESYAMRIQSLSAKIDELRLEKANILQNSVYDKDGSTRYFDLPTGSVNKSKEEHFATTCSAIEQEELERNLLSIDYGLVERLKKLTPEEINQRLGSNEDGSGIDLSGDSVDQALIQRLNKLLGKPSAQTHNIQPEPMPSSAGIVNPGSLQESEISDIPFVPILANIPRVSNVGFDSVKCTCKNTKPKPPISKGFTAAKRFNTDINLIPHELSTIAESELSTKMRQSPDKPLSPIAVDSSSNVMEEMKRFIALPQSCSDKTNIFDLNDVVVASRFVDNIVSEAKSSAEIQQPTKIKSPSREVAENEPYVMLTTPMPGTIGDVPSDSDSMEKMLKGLGMGWAIPTLRKTQEALNLQSSSSASDITLKSSRMFSDSNSSSSEISLREILGKRYLRKLSPHSPSKSIDSSTLNSNQFEDVSPIKGSGTSLDKTTHRTSTPVQSYKLEDKLKQDTQQQEPLMVVTGESELSSIKGNSEDCEPAERFYSLHESSPNKKDHND